ncbi:amine oxidase [Rubrobacter xylanophilus DSM 9941]|uniref:Amine oxidase n=1 Tax=Rubrobacter xylanophilus (strain DSM 9941 / JCM 11954 / NBRC 16129 / PRD-1) TaxID=266117 RepID=Q1AY07_RUBXD|nr:amine oxidase [Rubrobacter xylanophilus DSM 9941]
MVGAGLAGLTCAKVLHEGGAEVEVFEASDGVGGRVRTDEREGFLLDRGFQVYFTAYPAARRHLDHGALDLRYFDPGAVILRGGGREVLSDPLRDPGALPSTLLSRSATPADKARVAALALRCLAGRGPEAAGEAGGEDASTLACLERRGFSRRFIDAFFRPFYGGILLDRGLSASCRVFSFTFRMMARGWAAVPARGMGEIPRQLAARLPEGAVRLESPVEGLLREGGRVRGVRGPWGEREADAVVVATEAPVAGRLTGEKVPEGSVGEVCLYYETSGVGAGKKVLLNAEEDAFVNNAVEISNVSGLYAPPGRRLLYAVVLGGFDLPDGELLRRGVEELSRWCPRADFRPLGLRRIPYGQFAQPPGVHATLPKNRTSTPGLFLAGEYTVDSSINGAILSGERAAREVLGR